MNEQALLDALESDDPAALLTEIINALCEQVMRAQSAEMAAALKAGVEATGLDAFLGRQDVVVQYKHPREREAMLYRLRVSISMVELDQSMKPEPELMPDWQRQVMEDMGVEMHVGGKETRGEVH